MPSSISLCCPQAMPGRQTASPVARNISKICVQLLDVTTPRTASLR